MMTVNESASPPPGRWMTVAEAAEYTRTDEAWILGHIKSGHLRYVPTINRRSADHRGPRRRIIDRAKVDELMLSLERSEPQPMDNPAILPSKVRPRIAPRGMSLDERLKSGL